MKRQAQLADCGCTTVAVGHSAAVYPPWSLCPFAFAHVMPDLALSEERKEVDATQATFHKLGLHSCRTWSTWTG